MTTMSEWEEIARAWWWTPAGAWAACVAAVAACVGAWVGVRAWLRGKPEITATLVQAGTCDDGVALILRADNTGGGGGHGQGVAFHRPGR